MRVIAGTARHLQLVTPEGMETRPTTDRIKETLFNILQNDIYGCRFLDLFAGSGGIGIEALSRGAASAVFVDSSSTASACIKENLKKTGLADRAELLKSDFSEALKLLDDRKQCFDIIFIDPPYKAGLEEQILKAISESSLADENTLIILEASLDRELTGLQETGLRIDRIKKYKTNKHFFLSREFI